MKAVPRVNKDGLYLEDELVDDAFSGVVPFYAEIEPQPPADPGETEQEPAPEDEQPGEAPDPVIAGYIIGVPVTPGLFRPRFDIPAWETYQVELQAAESAYRVAYDEWQAQPEDERGEPPAYVPPKMPTLWIEGLTPEEIKEITRPQPKEPTELELLAEEVEVIRQQTIEQQEAIESSGTELVEVRAANAEQQLTIGTLGTEQIKLDLSTLDLKQQNAVLGAELVKKDIAILDLQSQNQALGQMLAALELKLLANGTGGEPNVQ
ncbi:MULTISPECIES: hypothetical protein [Paenibacillus]|uniref:Uncharacterized protein n=1 Tax=Paenibacillus lactis 154 TaxID=743719 RepID=G4HNW3_9BACL|nr:hypothetical protein [Paenibacillus lactis]EHB50127.1 hypothetical protein PaelaDRAFT_5674 [Paenibacillus lactis 154]